MRASLVSKEFISKGITTYWFKPESDINYIAGQFIEMHLLHNNPDNRGEKRWFTLSSSPSEDVLGITTKLPNGHISSFKKALLQLNPGDKVSISEPMGDFVLPKDSTIPLTFVAGGIGITPMRSMIKFLADSEEKRIIRLLYSANDKDELCFMELFDNYTDSTDIFLSNPPISGRGKVEHLTSNQILEKSKFNPESLIYVSGPEIMVESLETDLLEAGVGKDKLVLDFFPNYLMI